MDAGATLGVGIAGLVERHGVLLAAPNLAIDEPLDVRRGLRDRLGVDVARGQRRDLRDARRVAGRRGRRVRRHGAGHAGHRHRRRPGGRRGDCSAAPTASPARSGTWWSIPTARRARAGGAGAGSATRPAPAWRCSPARRPRPGGSTWPLGAPAAIDAAARRARACRRARRRLAGPRRDRRVRPMGGARAGQPDQPARSGDPRPRRRPGRRPRSVPAADRRWFDALLYSSEIRPAPRLAFAVLGEHAGAIGAAVLGRSAALR